MINGQRLINTFIEIAQIDSPSGEEKAMSDYIVDVFRNLGITTNRDAFGNIIARIEGSPGLNPILLSAHIDTVEPGRGVVPQVEGGIIHSSGNTILGADNKVAVAAILEVVTEISEGNLGEIFPLEIVFTLSEEVANLGAVNLDYNSIDARVGYMFDSGNPIGTIITASPFYNRFDVSITGTACHAGHPERGVNALKIAIEALSNITLGQVDDDTVCNIGLIEGGTARNTVPGSISLQGEVRSLEETKLEELTQKTVDVFVTIAEDFGGKAAVDVVRENSGFRMNSEHPLVKLGLKGLEELGIPPILKDSSGCYDANIFHEYGIEVLNFGNGSKDNHTTSESMAVADLEMLARIVLELVKA